MKRSKSGLDVVYQKVERTMVCLRCGEIGHKTCNCNAKIPKCQELEEEMNSRLSQAENNIPSEWKTDEFGYFLPSNERLIDSKNNWSNSVFCYNCGNPGHSEKDCLGPTQSGIELLFGPLMNNNSNKKVIEKQNLVEAIKIFCEKQQNSQYID